MLLTYSKDPLLATARFLVATIIGVLAFAGVIVAIGLGAVLTMQRSEIHSKLSAAGASDSGYMLIVTALVLVIALLAFAALFMRELFRIVGSVEQQDPFQPINADRLRSMGWFTVGSQIILFALAGIASWFGGFKQALLAEDAMVAGTTALVLTLVLFILARVFRVGAEMRSELEGTV